jgi:hypothetical protein
VVHHPVPLILEYFLTIQALHVVPIFKKVRYGSHTKVCFRRTTIFGEKKGFVVLKENYGDPDYECDSWT